jgi:hypothetical protein
MVIIIIIMMMLNEVGIAYFKVLSWYFPRRSKETRETTLPGQRPSRNSEGALP